MRLVGELGRRRQFDEDLLADALRSRFGQDPGASPRRVGLAVALLAVVAAVVGINVTVHFDFAAHLTLQAAGIPFAGGTLIGGAIAWVRRSRRRKIG